ncbi:MAG: DUF1631 domain-containing protein [Kangiellaceae bacterium]|nr:DUF1631 domain-containing protein [Kangiellaceae bacterium]
MTNSSRKTTKPSASDKKPSAGSKVQLQMLKKIFSAESNAEDIENIKQDTQAATAHLNQIMREQLESYNPEQDAVNFTQEIGLISSQTKTERVSKIILLIERLFDLVEETPHLTQNSLKLIQSLKPFFLKMALLDFQILFENRHSGRILLNELLRFSSTWSGQAGTFAHIQKLLHQTISNGLEVENRTQSLSLLNASTEKLTNYIKEINRKAEIFEKRLKQNEQGKAKIAIAQQWASEQMSTYILVKNLPEFVVSMLSQAWQHVVFLEYLKQDETNKALEIAKELIVSVQPIESIAVFEKFVELQPTLIEKLKAELEKSPYSFKQSQAFIEALEALHEDIILRAKQIIEEGPKEEIIRLKPTAPFAQKKEEELVSSKDVDKPEVEELSVSEWVNLSFEELEKDELSVNSDNSATLSSKEKNQYADRQILDLAKPGRWFIIYKNNAKINCKLSAYLEHNKSYLFVDNEGKKVEQFEEEQLLELLEKNKVKLIENESILERAYHQLVDEAMAEHVNKLKVEREKLREEIEKQQQQRAEEKARKIAEDEFRKQREKEIEQVKPKFSNLTVGSWLEMELDDKKVRCRLAAKIRKQDKYIFADRYGVKIKELTLEQLAAMYVDKQIDLTVENDIFNQALSSLIVRGRNLKSQSDNS